MIIQNSHLTSVNQIISWHSSSMNDIIHYENDSYYLLPANLHYALSYFIGFSRCHAAYVSYDKHMISCDLVYTGISISGWCNRSCYYTFDEEQQYSLSMAIEPKQERRGSCIYAFAVSAQISILKVEVVSSKSHRRQFIYL